MEKHTKVCDSCGKELVVIEPKMMGGTQHNMLTLTVTVRMQSLLPSGTYHFCSERHLLAWIKEQNNGRNKT